MSPIESVISSKASEPDALRGTGGSFRSRAQAGLFIFLCVEMGLFLFLLPWSAVWEQNWLLSQFPSWRPFYMNLYVRGAIGGIGLVNLWIGLSQAWNFRR